MKKQKIIYIIILIFLSFFVLKKTYAADFYVSQDGSGLKNGISAENSWAGWNAIDWDTDGEGEDDGIGGGDNLYVIGTIRSLIYPVNGYGLSESQRLSIKSYPDNPGKLWQGLEISGSGWIGPDAYGAYSKSVSFSTAYGKAAEWISDPWTDAISLTTMPGVPDSTWTSTGLYYCDATSKIAYYKPIGGMLTGKTLTAWADTSRVIGLQQKDYVTVSGLKLNNPILIYDGADYSIIENSEIFCSGTQYALQIGSYPGYMPANYGIIRGNYIHDCGNGIYFINQDYGNEFNNNDWLVENNFIANIRGTGDSHAIGIQGGTGNIFQNNYLYNAGSGITFWNGKFQIMRDNIVRFNRVEHMGYYGSGNGNGRGIEFSGETADSELTTGNLIYGNVISDCLYTPGTTDGVGIRIKNGIPSSGYSIKVLNNTVSDCYKNFFIMASNYENHEIGAYFHNNISYNPKADGYHVFVSYATDAIYDLSLNKNIYYGSGKFYYKSNTRNVLSEWKILISPQDADSLNANPNLDNYLVPKSGGIGIDAGENLSLLSTLGLLPSTVWPSGTNSGNILTGNQGSYGSGWDIGAYIFQSSGDNDAPASPSGLSVQ